jgi:allantoinase
VPGCSRANGPTCKAVTIADVDLLIRGATPFDLAVDEGRIVATGSELELSASETLEAAGLQLLPGAVDAHVHFNEPGRADWEGWATGSAAAAAGGTTCVIDMPLNAHPPTLDAPSFRDKLAAAAGVARTDFALWGGLVPGNLPHLAELAELGVVGFKAFMCPSGVDDFPAVDEHALREGMAVAAELGLPVAVHAESATITEGLTQRAGGRGWRDFLASRPVAAELEAIARAIALAAETGCSLHVVHVSTGQGVRLVAAARADAVDVTCETCPHYLAFEEDDLEKLGAIAKCAPPLRARADRDDLRAEVNAGRVQLIASDHSPSPPQLKEGEDAFAVWGGISGCQSLLPYVLSEGLAPALVGERPAARFGLAHKGRLEAGADADLVLVDRSSESILRTEDLRYRHRQSPFVGRRFRARVVETWLRGAPLSAGGPRGRFVRPGPE